MKPQHLSEMCLFHEMNGFRFRVKGSSANFYVKEIRKMGSHCKGKALYTKSRKFLFDLDFSGR